MYVTRILGGRPYQAYVPNPVFPKTTAEQARMFAMLDTQLRGTLHETAFADRAKYSLAQTNKRIADSACLSNAEAAYKFAIGVKHLDCKRLKRAHALIIGAGRSDFRLGPGWVGAPHPSIAWHVGSPAEDLSRLMNSLMSPPTDGLPASMIACTQLFRILQIHPFADGNGRAARLVSMLYIYQKIGPAVGFIDLLDHLWNRAETDINSISLRSQQDEDFSGIYKKIGEITAIKH